MLCCCVCCLLCVVLMMYVVVGGDGAEHIAMSTLSMLRLWVIMFDCVVVSANDNYNYI